jgi:hypothetical protein
MILGTSNATERDDEGTMHTFVQVARVKKCVQGVQSRNISQPAPTWRDLLVPQVKWFLPGKKLSRPRRKWSRDKRDSVDSDKLFEKCQKCLFLS